MLAGNDPAVQLFVPGIQLTNVKSGVVQQQITECVFQLLWVASVS